MEISPPRRGCQKQKFAGSRVARRSHPLRPQLYQAETLPATEKSGGKYVFLVGIWKLDMFTALQIKMTPSNRLRAAAARKRLPAMKFDYNTASAVFQAFPGEHLSRHARLFLHDAYAE